MDDDYADLVDVCAGRVSRRVFADPAVYEAELDRVFARSWLCVGHVSELPRPGDYVTRRLADDAVIFCRAPAGALHVFLNACAYHPGRRHAGVPGPAGRVAEGLPARPAEPENALLGHLVAGIVTIFTNLSWMRLLPRVYRNFRIRPAGALAGVDGCPTSRTYA